MVTFCAEPGRVLTLEDDEYELFCRTDYDLEMWKQYGLEKERIVQEELEAGHGFSPAEYDAKIEEISCRLLAERNAKKQAICDQLHI